MYGTIALAIIFSTGEKAVNANASRRAALQLRPLKRSAANEMNYLAR
jgi:hypothetical protein